ncbi:TetR family transcriptional regulator [Virgisporangium aliadipatigenens]|uniref:TetR family transcriptional regulator n=1 Tax=Virgisporangium aliadipatigenens TaxID=741659 RepID=A0A8J4DQ94_9ACTN|nr:TetR family transcriptional regulator [Virgisporangium aliadipatigenens]GIJ45177.1 TetR family transcriptional regulator [Virgisporangium aliadipatigenens]
MSTSARTDRRARLIDAAAALFGARGFDAVTVADIGAAVGLSGPAVYRHFPDKRALLAEVLLRAAGETHAAVDAGLDLAALVRSAAAVAVERRDAGALWRTEGRHLSPEQRRAIGRRYAATLAIWVRVLRVHRPELSADAADLLGGAAIAVFGSVSAHHTTLARTRFVALLSAVAERVLAASQPLPGGPAQAAARPGVPVGAHPVGPSPGADAPGALLAEPSRRELILTAAAGLFHRHGFAAVTMSDIGRAVGIAGPSLYRHFSGKPAILDAIARRAADRLAADADRIMHAVAASPGSDDARAAAALRLLAESYVRALTGSPDLTVAFSIDTAHLDDGHRAELLQCQRDYVSRWAGLLRTVHPGLDRREATVVTHAALGIANDLTRTRRYAKRVDALPTLMTAALGS